jgi:hypothetical protein
MENGMAEKTRITSSWVAYVRWCREQGDSWDEIADAVYDPEMGERVTGDQVCRWFEEQTDR